MDNFILQINWSHLRDSFGNCAKNSCHCGVFRPKTRRENVWSWSNESNSLTTMSQLKVNYTPKTKAKKNLVIIDYFWPNWDEVTKNRNYLNGPFIYAIVPFLNRLIPKDYLSIIWHTPQQKMFMKVLRYLIFP